MGAYTFEHLRKDYEAKWAACHIPGDKLTSVRKAVQRILANSAFYEEAENLTGVPKLLIGAIHLKEASCRNTSQLINGEPWNKKTTLVPRGLGGWNSWMESTVFAFKDYKNYNWPSIEFQLWFAEIKWNGAGYRKYHPEFPSPYLWSHTSLYSRGLYVSDGKFDPNAVSKNPGISAIFKFFEDNTIIFPKG